MSRNARKRVDIKNKKKILGSYEYKINYMSKMKKIWGKIENEGFRRN